MVRAIVSADGRLHLTLAMILFTSSNKIEASDSTANTLRSTIDEYVEANASIHEAHALTDFADKPLVVLTAGAENDAHAKAVHAQLAAFSTNSAHRVVDGATHPSLILEKRDAAETTRAILDVVSAVRDSNSQVR